MASGQHWRNTSDAVKGVPPEEVKQHKKAGASCWKYGRDHHTHFCYALQTIGGTDLPAVPAAAASVTLEKRKREESEAAETELPAPKQSRTSVARTENNDMREVIQVWAEDSSEEEGYEDCADF